MPSTLRTFIHAERRKDVKKGVISLGILWTKKNISMYEAASNLASYPEIPLKKHFIDMIRPGDTVMDIGSGPGVVSLYLSSLCKRIIAVEQDKNAYEHLKRRVREREITNIHAVNSSWPDQALEPCDVTLVLHVYRLMHDFERVKDLLNSTRRTGMIMFAHPQKAKSFHKELARRLGIEKNMFPCTNGCRTAAFLEAEGAKVRCEKVQHEFGQPVNDLDEAASFFCQQLHLGDEYLERIREIAHEYIESREGKPYIPLERANCLIIFEK